ncbi:MAG TPA: MlaD family protein [Bryobacteraceae bacterium]|nr:MlaD family protein [Bryobacteraceae bacterium]
MPQRTKAKWAELRVGIMAIVALGLAGYLIFLITGSGGLFESTSKIYTYFSDTGDLAAGAPVRLNGIVIGKIDSVTLSGSTDPNRVIKVEMDVENKFLPSIPVDSVAGIDAGNLLGTKYINISKGRSGEHIPAGGELRSAQSAEMTQLFAQGNNALAALQDFVKKADDLLDEIMSGKGTLGKLLVDPTIADKAVGIEDEAQKLLAALNSNKGTIPRWLNNDELFNDVHGTLARIDTLMDGLQQGNGTLGMILKDPAMYNNTLATISDLRKAIGSVQQTLDTINSGKGTIGALLKNGDLHDELSTSLKSLNTLLDKVNNGQGTVGLLLNDPSLYQSLNGTTDEMHSLLKDFRANPKKFLSIKLHIF